MAKIIGIRTSMGVVGMAIAALALVAAPAGAIPKPKVVVTPSAGLAAHARVKVSGKHLGDNNGVAILECNAANMSLFVNGCNLGNIVDAETSATGVLVKTKFKVVDQFMTSDGPVNCTNAASPCIVLVADQSSPTVLGDAPISFDG